MEGLVGWGLRDLKELGGGAWGWERCWPILWCVDLCSSLPGMGVKRSLQGGGTLLGLLAEIVMILSTATNYWIRFPGGHSGLWQECHHSICSNIPCQSKTQPSQISDPHCTDITSTDHSWLPRLTQQLRTSCSVPTPPLPLQFQIQLSFRDRGHQNITTPHHNFQIPIQTPDSSPSPVPVGGGGDQGWHQRGAEAAGSPQPCWQ